MPIYEYRCGGCGHRLEALQKLSEDPLKECPECREEALKRLVSAPAFRLKGGGWYETDFKTDKEKKRNLADKPESKDGKATEKEKTGSEAGKASPSKESAPKESASSSGTAAA